MKEIGNIMERTIEEAVAEYRYDNLQVRSEVREKKGSFWIRENEWLRKLSIVLYYEILPVTKKKTKKQKIIWPKQFWRIPVKVMGFCNKKR